MEAGAEDGGACTDAQGDSDCGSEREDGALSQRSAGERQIA
jgi:hypothetical protein